MTTSAAPLSLWHDDAAVEWGPTTVLPGDREVDVAVVGAGYTGLWTAYYLAQADPTLRVAVLESEFVGFGASGRNGGWCSAIFPTTLRKIAGSTSRDAAVRMQRAMNDTVAEIQTVLAAESIDCDFRPSVYLSVARNPAQWTRAQNEVAGWREWGFGEDHMRLLEPGSSRTGCAWPTAWVPRSPRIAQRYSRPSWCGVLPTRRGRPACRSMRARGSSASAPGCSRPTAVA